MYKSLILCAIFCFATNMFAQQRGNGTFHEVKNKDMVLSVFPTAEKVEKENNFWFRILDKNKNVIGYALSSAPYCKEVVGYSGNTPVLIITDTKLKILKVALLSNWETPAYVSKLESRGFFKKWDNKTLKKAQATEIDGYSGATMTARAVDKNVQYLLENGMKNLPGKK